MLLFLLVVSFCSAMIPLIIKEEVRLNNVKESSPQYFSQLIDHFNISNNDTFQQMYLENLDVYDNASHVLILYISGEQTLYPVRASSMFHYELAKKYHAALYLLEHRYYGSSFPFEESPLSVDHLKFLSTEQALADIAYFLGAVLQTARFNPPNDIRKVIVVGGSYAGVLSSLFRAFYPQFASISLSSSAPVDVVDDFYQYDQTIQEGLGETCADLVRRAYAEIEGQIENKTVSLENAVKDIGCDPGVLNETVDFYSTITDVSAGLVQYNNPTNRNVEQLCATMENESISSSLWERFYWFVTNVYLPVLENDSCDNISDARSTLLNPDKSNWYRAWFYQTCTEYGYFQTAPKPPLKSLRSQQINKTYYEELCVYAFGSNSTHLDVNLTNAKFGGLYSFATDVMFTNGDKDPWSRLGITDPSFYVHGEPARQNWDVWVTANGSHCSELYTPTANDSAAVNATREKIVDRVAAYIGDVTLYGVEEDAPLYGVLGLIVSVVGMAVGGLLLIIAFLLVLCMYRRYRAASNLRTDDVGLLSGREFGESISANKGGDF